MIMCKRKINNIKFSTKVVYCRDFSHYDTNTVRNELSYKRWVNVYNTNDATIVWQNLKLKLAEIIDQHAPKVSKRVKGKNSLAYEGNQIGNESLQYIKKEIPEVKM